MNSPHRFLLSGRINSAASAAVLTRAVLALAVAALVAACSDKKEDSLIRWENCRNVALLNDYLSVRAIEYHAATQSITAQPLSNERVASQAAVTCDPALAAIAFNYVPGSDPRSAVEVISSSGRSKYAVPEGLNGLVLTDSTLYLATARLKRARVNSELGPLSRKELDSSTGEHLFTELIMVDVARMQETRRLRYPAPSMEWISGDLAITLGASILEIDLRTGARRELFNFATAPYFPQAVASFHLIDNSIYAVTGTQSEFPTSVPLGSILKLDPTARRWEVVTRGLPAKATFAFDDGSHFLIFDDRHVHEIDAQGTTLRTAELPIAGLQVRAVAQLEDATLVIAMRPKEELGVFEAEASVLALDANLKVVASRSLSPVGNALMLSSASRPLPSGNYGYLGEGR